ncbi:MAG TPA: rhodanese family protein [Rhodospirillales bacterium]
MEGLKTISPKEAAALLCRGAALVDIREADEHARERIPGARHRPLSKIGQSKAGTDGEILIFHCRSGMRTQANAATLADGAAGCEAYVLEGGLEAWKKAGLPVATDRNQPIEIIRQVQIAAGSLVLIGVILGFAVHPGFFALSAFVGAGLVTAGVTGFCGMAKLLARMPWNRPARARSAA